jgi:hypothetical protein
MKYHISRVFRQSVALGMLVVVAAWGELATGADDALPQAKPVPLMQVTPQAGGQAAVQRTGDEICRYHFGPELRRPFLFPLVGPSGRSVTRMAHPRDPNGHSHHNSVWISHHSLNGVNFWADNGDGRIVHRLIEKYEDADGEATIVARNDWVDRDGRKILRERREMRFIPAEEGQWWLWLDLTLTVDADPATFDKTPFGLVGVRMAKTIGVHDGGGRIRNSEGKLNEPEVHWQRARWVDYAGPITREAVEGVTLMDHPGNPNHPTYFHVRNDGWMGASLSYEGPVTVTKDQPLRLRYALWIHRNASNVATLDQRFHEYVERVGP